MEAIASRKRQSYPGVDIVRFICAALVVGIHVYPFGNNGDPFFTELNFLTQVWLGRNAVPFFLVCGGFFLFMDTERQPFPMDKVSRYIRKLLRLYLLWNLLYTPLILKEILLVHPEGIGMGALRFLRDFLLKGSYYHLWYLHAAMVGTALVGLLLRKGVSIRRILLMALVLFGIGLLGQSYFGILMRLRYRLPPVWRIWEIYEQIFVTTRNGLFEGLMYIGLGVWFARNKRPIPLKRAAVGLALSMLLALGELLLLRRLRWLLGTDMFVCQIPCTFFLFALALALPVKERPLWRHLRQLGSICYFLHVWVFKLLQSGFTAVGVDITVPGRFYLSTMVLTLALAEVLLRLQKKPKLGFLRQLF